MDDLLFRMTLIEGLNKIEGQKISQSQKIKYKKCQYLSAKTVADEGAMRIEARQIHRNGSPEPQWMTSMLWFRLMKDQILGVNFWIGVSKPLARGDLC